MAPRPIWVIYQPLQNVYNDYYNRMMVGFNKGISGKKKNGQATPFLLPRGDFSSPAAFLIHAKEGLPFRVKSPPLEYIFLEAHHLPRGRIATI